MITLGEMLKRISCGTYRARIEKIRELLNTAPKKANALKEQLPGFKAGGAFRGLSAGDLIELSGLLCLDLDCVDEAACVVRDLFAKDPHVVALFTSPRGMGLKVLVAVTARNGQEHRSCFKAALGHFSGVLPEGVKIDTTPICYVPA